MKNILLIFPLLFTTFLFGQNRNTYQFIEPNISISYDSNSFSIGQRYSNTFYETENYDFTLKNDSSKIRILVKANIPSASLYLMSDLQKSMTSKIDDIRKQRIENVKIVSYDKEVEKVGDFLCLGVVNYVEPIKTYMTSIISNHVSENDLTEVDFSFPYSQNLDSCYKIASEFLSGFKFYSKVQVNYEDSLIKRLYSVSVITTKDTIENFKWRKSTFLGIVKINEPLQHKVKEVRLDFDNGEEIFVAMPNGEVPIICNDKEKGEIKKHGKLIILNSFGKIVKIPFEFVYELK